MESSQSHVPSVIITNSPDPKELSALKNDAKILNEATQAILDFEKFNKFGSFKDPFELINLNSEASSADK